MGLEAALRRDRHPACCVRPSATNMYWRCMQLQAPLRSAASSRATSSSRISPPPAMACSPRSSSSTSCAAPASPLHELIADLKVFPQVIVNIRVQRKEAAGPNRRPSQHTIREAEAALNGNGRVVVRYSGTEPLARVMIEAESEETMRRHADSIAARHPRRTGSLTQYFRSRQFAPVRPHPQPAAHSTRSHAPSRAAPSRSPRSISASGTSKSSSSCTCSVIRVLSFRPRARRSMRIIASLIRSAAVPCSGVFTAVRSANPRRFALRL